MMLLEKEAARVRSLLSRPRFPSFFARHPPASMSRDTSSGRPWCRFGRWRAPRGRRRERERLFAPSLLTAKRFEQKSARFPTLRARGLAAPPPSLSRQPSRDARGRHPELSRERSRRQRAGKGRSSRNVFFCARCFFCFQRDGATTTLCPLVDSSLASSLSSSFPRGTSFRSAFSCCSLDRESPATPSGACVRAEE